MNQENKTKPVRRLCSVHLNKKMKTTNKDEIYICRYCKKRQRVSKQKIKKFPYYLKEKHLCILKSMDEIGLEVKQIATNSNLPLKSVYRLLEQLVEGNWVDVISEKGKRKFIVINSFRFNNLKAKWGHPGSSIDNVYSQISNEELRSQNLLHIPIYYKQKEDENDTHTHIDNDSQTENSRSEDNSRGDEQ